MNMKKYSENGALFILMATLLWSLNGVLIKFIPWQPMTISGTRAFLAFITLMLIKHDLDYRINVHIILASLCYAFMGILFVYATKLTTAANAIVLQYTAPIFVIIFSIFLFARFPSKRQVLCIIAAFIGISLFFIEDAGGGKLTGNLLAILAGIGYSGVYLFNAYEDSDALTASILGNVIIFLISVPSLYLNGDVPIGVSGVLAVIILGVFQMGVSYAFFSHGIKYINNVDASLISMLEAILNPIWVMIFIGEYPGTLPIIGASLVLASVFANILGTKKENGLLELVPHQHLITFVNGKPRRGKDQEVK